MELDPRFARRLADTAQSIILVLDLEGQVVYFNPYLEKLSGFLLDDVCGRGWWDVFLPQRDHGRLRAALGALYDGASSTNLVSPIVTRSGEEIMIEWSATVLTDDDDALRAVLAVGHDVTEQLHEAEQRVEAETRLRRSEAMLRRAQAIAHFGSFDAGAPYRRGDIAWSDELYRILGWDLRTQPPSLSTTLRRILHPEDRATTISRLRHAARTGDGFELDCRTLRTDGATRHVHVVVEPAGPDGGEHRWVGVAHDVTEQRKLEEEMRRTQKLEAVGRLTSGIAHDYNNLLMGIIGCIDLAERHSPPGGGARAYLAEARKAAKEGASLTRQLLTFARPQEVRPSLLSVDSVVDESAKMFRSVLGEHVQLEVSLAVRRWRVRIDRGQLDQILMNLVVNARDAMPHGGVFTILTDETTLLTGPLPPGDYVRMCVSDTGVGMDAGTIAKIFDPYYTTKPPERGTGIGLATVYAIVSQAGGHIDVDSEPGRGTSIVLHLPRARSSRDLEDSHRTPMLPRLGTEAVLVVEDEPLIRTAVRTQLVPLGYRVDEAADVTEASLLLQRPGYRVDLVLTDVSLPGGSGLAVVEQLHALEVDCPVIFMSVHEREVLEQSGAIPSGSRALTKPFTAEELAAEVRRALD